MKRSLLAGLGLTLLGSLQLAGCATSDDADGDECLPGDIDCSTWAQLLLKFVISHPAVTCVIPATSKVEHLRDNMRAALAPMPDAAMRDEIVSAARAAR